MTEFDFDDSSMIIECYFEAFPDSYPHPVLGAILRFPLRQKHLVDFLGTQKSTLGQYTTGHRSLPAKYLPKMILYLEKCIYWAEQAMELAEENMPERPTKKSKGKAVELPPETRGRRFTKDEVAALQSAIDNAKDVLEKWKPKVEE